MAKTCKADNCYSPVWGGGYCKNHQWKRTDKKPKKSTFRTKRERIRDFNWGFDSQVELFDWLWEEARNEEGKVICPYTGVDITSLKGKDIYYSCFAHVLAKGRYPWFKLNPKNVRVVSPAFHTLVDQGTSEQRARYPDWKFSQWYNDVEAMKIAYGQFKKDNLLS